MIISNNSIVGSFVLSVISPWRGTDDRFPKPVAVANCKTIIKATRQITNGHVPSEATVNIESPQGTVLTEPVQLASTKFTPGHRRSGATSMPPRSSPPQGETSLNNFANTLRSKIHEYNARINPSLAQPKQRAAPLSPILEEIEEDQADIVTSTFGHSPGTDSPDTMGHQTELSSQSSDNVIVEEEDSSATFSVGLPFPLRRLSQQSATTSDTISSLQSEIVRLKSDISTADQEIQNLNAELADSLDSEQLIQEAEERMEELLIEKMEWSKTQKALTQNLTLVTDDLQSTKHYKTLLQHDNEKLREIIQYYQLSANALHPRPNLLHQDAIDRSVTELIWPLSPLRISDHQQEAGIKTARLPPTVDADTVIRPCATFNDVASSTPTLPFAESLGTPPGVPHLRSTKSLRLRKSSPSGLRTSSIPQILGDGSPVRQNYKPAEGSPLKVVSTLSVSDEAEMSHGAEGAQSGGNSLLLSSTLGLAYSQDDDEYDEIGLYDCDELSDSGGGDSGGRISRLGMLPGGFGESIFL